jgi:Helix-turn-helix domain
MPYMVRSPLTAAERIRGAALGRALQLARGRRSAVDVALQAGISLDTLRKIERGAIPTPAFFTVAALARVLDLELAQLARLADATGPAGLAGGEDSQVA